MPREEALDQRGYPTGHYARGKLFFPKLESQSFISLPVFIGTPNRLLVDATSRHNNTSNAPPAKRICREPREQDTLGGDSDSDAEFDTESFYRTGETDDTHEEVAKFIETTFTRCLPRKKRLAIARDSPLPNLVGTRPQVADSDIVSILGKDFPAKSDKELRRLQAAALAPCAPIASLWSQMAQQGFSGKPEEDVPASEVLKVIRETLALVGNASAYIAQARRQAIIDKVKSSRPQLAAFMSEVCKEGSSEPCEELFGRDLKRKLSERAETISSFNKVLTTLDPPKPKRVRFLQKGSGARYSSGPGYSTAPMLYNNNNNNNRPPRGRPQRRFSRHPNQNRYSKPNQHRTSPQRSNQ